MDHTEHVMIALLDQGIAEHNWNMYGRSVYVPILGFRGRC